MYECFGYLSTIKKDYYLRDASGNVMSIYKGETIGPTTTLFRTEAPLYGSSRVAMDKQESPDLLAGGINTNPKRYRSHKFFELSNHLGNVLSSVSDRRLGAGTTTADYFDAEIVSATDYFPFGMEMPGREMSGTEYRFGFNGKEKDEDGEWGNGTHYDYGFRIYNPGIGKFLSVDPLTGSYPELTPYQFASNSPIANIDLDGLESYWAADGSYLGKYGESTEMRIIIDNEIIDRARNALGNNKTEKLSFFKKDLPNSSTIAYEATAENELSSLRNWAKGNRTNKEEHVMSLFTKFIESADGIGYFRAIAEGSTGIGPPHVPGKNASVNPEKSKGPQGWRRSTTIHNHPYGRDYSELSNIPKTSLASGGDIQWAIEKHIKIYMVPLNGDFMGVFDPQAYIDYVIKKIEADNEKYKAKSPNYQLNHPYRNDYKGDSWRGYWLEPHVDPTRQIIKNDIIKKVSIEE